MHLQLVQIVNINLMSSDLHVRDDSPVSDYDLKAKRGGRLLKRGYLVQRIELWARSTLLLYAGSQQILVPTCSTPMIHLTITHYVIFS